MKGVVRILFICLMINNCISVVATEEKDFETAVRESVSRQLQLYPQSTLKDLYKNFFQDVFGPGHIISDTTSAGNYLRRELASYNEISGDLTEPLGWQHHFLRVNLSVLKTGQISYPVFFDAFVRSVNGIQPITVPEWERQWYQIEAIIHSMNLSLPDYERDKQEIHERLKRGEYVGHHSLLFEENYSPHYRIISREIFEKELLPLLK
ncbi:hypothetical protein [Parabacteroides sp. PF5-9]|uniref:hypothetical protein n=1 Tax=Parabacteroides sp. PF5-9 TaxID=1742404 RepID=UPI002476CFE5|nr:hypothetical protein [Parabacteroides sp. PF5-9]MDH6356451.1 hypothetical protein [Parabacteroides sp. PF5-9]